MRDAVWPCGPWSVLCSDHDAVTVQYVSARYGTVRQETMRYRDGFVYDTVLCGVNRHGAAYDTVKCGYDTVTVRDVVSRRGMVRYRTIGYGRGMLRDG